jgi:hypothetical protein
MAPFFLQRRGGAGVGRVFAFASIANQPHKLENRYVPGSGVGARSIANRRALVRAITYRPPAVQTPSTLIYSKDTVVDGGFTVGAEVNKTVNDQVTLGMSNALYTSEFNSANYPEYPQLFPDMADLIEENIVLGDKNEEDRLIASYWGDLGNDVLDEWGFFYLYDVNSGKYYFPLISPQNQGDGIFATQTFNAFGRTFTIKHGWAVQGIFKFDISVADDLPFRFGAYGDMGWGNLNDANESLTQNYTLNGQNLTLYYNKDYNTDDNVRQMHSYWIPKKISENSAKTYNTYYNGEDMVMLSKDVTVGLIVYFAKLNDVKDWVINDLAI